MGGSLWSDDFYKDREADRRAKGTDAFVYNKAVSAKPREEQKVHELMSPKRKKIRESRDSKEHPNSLAIGVLFDITGSMSDSPKAFQSKLGTLMNRLITKGYVADPQILVGCIGDANDLSDSNDVGIFDGSCQIGEFESGIEIDDCLGRCWLAGGGGGQVMESYQNAAYFFARYVVTDCFEKRGQKGCLFILGDEYPYPAVSLGEVKAIFGDSLQEDIPTSQIFAELRQKWDVFFILPQETSHGTDPRIRREWEKYVGAGYVFALNSADNVSELVALITGIREGKITDFDAVRQEFRAEGISGHVANGLLSSVHKYAESKGIYDQSRTARL